MPRFKFAPLQGDRAGDVQAWAHGAEGMAGQPPHSLPSGGTAFVASVAAPSLTSAMLDQLQRRFEHVHVVRTSAECAGVRIAYAKPEKFGVDRFLALLAAAKAQRPVLVVGVGTALTIDLLDADGEDSEAFRFIRSLRNEPAVPNPFACVIVTTWAPTRHCTTWRTRAPWPPSPSRSKARGFNLSMTSPGPWTTCASASRPCQSPRWSG